ncbi:hypothetical protein LCGC14_1315830 [marine sediment metagenome]|uniref:SbsA Ig-like domain-containing protein n=1 Tax=marine sediment metagenome TaxID=412755 RepID=A0A0F9KLJ8_9ZZZZ
MAVVNISGTIEVLVASTAALTEIPPTITVAATGPTSVRVTFSKIMQDDMELDTPSNYTLTPITPNTAPVAVNAATPEGGGSPTFVDLTVTEMTDGATYELAVDPNVVDLTGQPVEVPAQFTGQGQKPSVVSATALTTNKIRVVFDELMSLDGLNDRNNYTVTPQAAGVGAVFVNSVDLIGVNPSLVDLNVTEMKDGGSYLLEVDSSGPVRDVALNPVDPANDSTALVGVGEKPTLLRAEAISKTRVDLIFSETMRDNSDIRTAENYLWDTAEAEDDITTIAVLAVAENTVKLVTDEQTPSVQYNLTIG